MPPTQTREKERVGQVVYRVYGSPQFHWYGMSWTPINAKLYGPQMFRVFAGLPDALSQENCLAPGILINIAGIGVQGAGRMDPPNSYRSYQGGLAEYVIPNARV